MADLVQQESLQNTRGLNWANANECWKSGENIITSKNKKMKAKLFASIICLFIVINLQAKNLETYDSIIATGDTLTVFNHSFPVMQDAEGFRFIQAQKMNGKPYRVPVWEKTGDKFEGHDVYRYKNNGYFYYGLSKHGFPNYQWLIKQK